jgi:glutamate-1-semialdehyde 2,1-aminomutase
MKNLKKNKKMFVDAMKNIPLASQTFSKSYKFLPKDRAPLFLKKGKGCHVYDYDNNKYIDLINGLLSVSLGYNIKEIDNPVKKQMKDGVNFSLPNLIENKLAKELIKLIPCAEMVRYGKNGSDATSAAIRLSRAYTKKDIVLFCGYHGWHDWYIGKTTMNNGVPKEVSNLSKTFKFNDLESFNFVFNKYKEKIAAVILEPMSFDYPKISFLKRIKSECKKNKTVLIFDETCTGFRFSTGGAQKLFGVIPDLSTFGKGVANGYPLSILVGEKKIMKLCDKIFFSSTFGGETLSLVAAYNTIKFIKEKSVIPYLYKLGKKLIDEINKTITNNNLDFVQLKGHPSWSLFQFKNYKNYSNYTIKTYFLEKCIDNGILTLGTNNLSYSHKKKDINKIIKIYKKILLEIKKKINNKEKLIIYSAIKPLFQVRS